MRLSMSSRPLRFRTLVRCHRLRRQHLLPHHLCRCHRLRRLKLLRYHSGQFQICQLRQRRRWMILGPLLMWRRPLRRCHRLRRLKLLRYHHVLKLLRQRRR